MDKNIKEELKNTKKFVKQEGYKIKNVLQSDWGRTVKLVVAKDGKDFLLPIVENFFDVNNDGETLDYYGTLYINETPWYKNHMKNIND